MRPSSTNHWFHTFTHALYEFRRKLSVNARVPPFSQAMNRTPRSRVASSFIMLFDSISCKNGRSRTFHPFSAHSAFTHPKYVSSVVSCTSLRKSFPSYCRLRSPEPDPRPNLPLCFASPNPSRARRARAFRCHFNSSAATLGTSVSCQ